MPIVEIHLLGTFEIYVESQLVSYPLVRSKKLRHLVEFLILNRNRAVPNDEVIHALWSKHKNKDSRNALKLLIHRLRISLVEGGAPPELDFLITQQGTCRWNPEIHCTYDFEKFNILCTVGSHDRQHADIAYLHLSSACDLYRGKLMNDASGESWQQTISEQMHKNFLNAAKCLIHILTERKMYEEIINLCQRILCIDSIQAEIHEAYIFALAQTGYNQVAAEHYLEIAQQHYKKEGLRPPEKLYQLYEQVMDTERKTNRDIDLICEELREKEQAPGAFVCSYEVFGEVYRLEARNMIRYNTGAVIVLLTMSDVYEKKRNNKLLAKIMMQLLECARMSLRQGDLIARYSPTQIVMMLPTATIETAKIVCERVNHNFEQQYPKSNVLISYSVRQMKPLDISHQPVQNEYI